MVRTTGRGTLWIVVVVVGVGVPKADTDPEVPSGPIATTDTPYGVLVLSPLNVHVDVIDVVVKVEGALKP
jgi:hypothetical protein